MRIRFDVYPTRLLRRGPGWALAIVSRDAPWWVKARAIRGLRLVVAGKSYWLWVG